MTVDSKSTTTDKSVVDQGEPRHFRLCSSCKKALEFGKRYYVCSVSTCNRSRNPLTFCSLPCFEAHVPVLRHREAWAEEKTAPTRDQFLAERELAESSESAAAGSKQLKPASRDGSGEDWRESPAQRAKQRPEQVVDNERLGRVALNRSPGTDTRAPSVVRRAATASGFQPAATKELLMSDEQGTKEVLVVISKVKAYIRAKSSMNTSDAVTEALSDLVRTTCDQAIEKAKGEGRKTVMARDIAGSPGASE
jgi:hypothetical protein